MEDADQMEKLQDNTEKYSSGRRGAPAKGVGRATGARVQIPLSPLPFPTAGTTVFTKKMKKQLTKLWKSDILKLLSAMTKKSLKK